MKHKITILLLYLFSFPLFGQSIRYITENEGLPQSFISGLLQDREGYIWIGTRNGLARYDGHNFRIFQHHPTDKNSLASSAVTDMHQGAGNEMWIEYESGEIDIFDLDNEKVTHIVNHEFLRKTQLSINRRAWCVDNTNTLWYLQGSMELKGLRHKRGNVLKTRLLSSFAQDTIRSLFAGSKGRLWTITRKGINQHNINSGKFVTYPIPFKQHFDDNFGRDIPGVVERSNGELMWIDSFNIFFFDIHRHTFRRISLPEKNQGCVRWISTGPDGKEYFTAGVNVYSYDDRNGLLRQTNSDRQELRDIQAFLVDRSGLIWTGGNGYGILQIDLFTNFRSFPYVNSFAIDILKKYLHFPVSMLPTEPTPQGALPLSYYLRSINNSRYIWIALNRSVYRYTIESGKIEDFSLPGKFASTFQPIKGISLDTNGSPVVVDQLGIIYVYKNQWEPLKLDAKGFADTLAKSIPNDIYFDGKKIWITTEYGGLFYIDKTNLTFQKAAFYNKNGFTSDLSCLYKIVPDPTDKKVLWIGSPQGLIRFNTQTSDTNIFSTEQGLPDNVIYSILPDESGHLWLGTNKGLVRFDLKQHTSRKFTKSYGLPSNEFNRFHQLLLQDGKMAYGGINGYVIFDPAETMEDNHHPRIGITGISVNNIPLKEDFVYSADLKKLHLTHNDNTLSITYAALQFNHPQDIQYRYRLKGYDTDWVLAHERREAIYTKIPPGNYTFEVNATNTTGVWSKHVNSLPIKISPPWWNTWLAWMLYLIIFILSVFQFTNFRVRQRLMKQEILIKEKESIQLRELDNMKTRFFSNITHELRTPLTLILGPAEELTACLRDEKQSKLAEVITKNTGSLLNLTNQLLEISKLEAGALKPHLAAGDLAELIKRTVSAFKEEVHSKQINIKLEASEGSGYFFDSEMMERIMYNLLSNAIRFSPNGGSIAINLIGSETGATIRISDNGPGIHSDDLPYIFSRFYRGKSIENKSAAGSGIGLSLVKELVLLQGGSINVVENTEYGTGASFVIFLPLQPYTPEDSDFSTERNVKELQDKEDFEKPLVMVVEDNREIAEFIRTILSPQYTIIEAENGIKALPLAISLLPHMIISDVLMEGMDGFALCQAIKTDDNTSHIPVLLLTAKTDMESKLEGFSYGADDYMAKPFSVKELLARVKSRLVQQKHMRDAVYRELTSLPEITVVKKIMATDPFLLKVYQAIDENIERDDFGIEDLSSALLIGRTSLHVKIKSLTGMTTSEMLRAYRLTKALPLLHQNLTIAEIAYKIGFASPSYFTRSFKEVYGITPSEYLKKSNSEQ